MDAGDHIVQGIKHRSKPMYAVQFHPESVMTQDGYRLLANWLKVCEQESAVEKSIGLQPKVSEYVFFFELAELRFFAMNE